ncbi:glycosyltransferase, partial [Saprospiraceae bacterium]|nr:glycosyltransferase [Saprospiraceae bacterium]
NVVEAFQPLFKKQNVSLNNDEIYALGLALQMTNRPEKAIEVLTQVELFSDHFASAQALRQKIYYQLKDFPNSIKACLESLKGNPNDVKALRQFGIAYRANAQHKEAFKTASKLLSISEPHSQQHMEAITLIGTEARLTNEQKYIAQAVEQINPIKLVKGSRWNFALQLIALLSAMGAYDEAYDVSLNLLDRNPNSTTLLMWISNLKTLTGRSDVQFNLPIKQALSKPHGIEILLGEALSEAKHGDKDSALEKLLASQEYDNDNLHIYKRVAEAYISSDNPKKAIAHLKGALKLAPKDSSISQLIDHLQQNAKTQMPSLSFEDGKILSIMGNPKVSIVVPCYNEARFLSDCLNSVWMQSYPYWECIIIDDNGSDQSAKIAEAYCKSDDRFKYYRHKNNKGLAASRNTGLKIARGDYITFLDADDFLSLDSINSRYQILQKRDNEFIGGVYCQIRPCDEDKFIPLSDHNEKRLPSMSVKNFVSTGFEAPFNAHAPLIKISILRDIEGFTESMKNGAEDWDCWQRIMRMGYTFLPSNYIGGYYRQKRGSMVRALSRFHIAEAEKIYQRTTQNDNNIDTDVYNFKYPVWVYQGIQSFYKRALRFASMAYMAGDIDGFYEIVGRLPGSKRMCDALNFSIKNHVYEGVNRFLSSTDELIGVVDRKLYKEECTTQISDIIIAQIEHSHPDTNIEILFPNASETKSKKGSASKPSTTTFIPSVPAYVKLEESQKRVKDLDRIKKLHNIHAGERVFIVGNGPSLNKIDLSKLNDEYSIAVNGIFYKTEQSGYKPTYYVVEDTSVMRENIADIKAYEVEKKFFPTIYTDIHPADESTYFFKMNRGFYEPKSPNYCVPRFSTDFSQRAFCGQSVTFINLQLAFYMGFTEVYLIGMDFSYIIPENFERKGDIITSTDDDPNHFHPDYFGKGKTWKDPKLDRVLANYNMAKLAYETAGRKIYNATAGGKLELFERKKFDSLFK